MKNIRFHTCFMKRLGRRDLYAAPGMVASAEEAADSQVMAEPDGPGDVGCSLAANLERTWSDEHALQLRGMY